MILLILFAFIAGLVTILSPCILPILPIVLGSSTGDQGLDRKRPLGVVLGFVASFTFFTMFLSTIVRLIGIPADSLRLFSILIVFGVGISMIFPWTQMLIEKLFTRISGISPDNAHKSGFGGGFLIGLSLGLLWTPCVGPILASVISLAITGTVSLDTFFITLAYALGTSIPMFLILITGHNLFKRFPLDKIQKTFGVVMIVMAVGLFFNIDRRFQTFILDKFPNYGTGLTKIEDNPLVKSELTKQREESRGTKAPEIIPGGAWFNLPIGEASSSALTIASLRGRVVLIDFWTYTCINCQRTLPYLKSWYEKYKDKGLVIIGVHSPEFEFEKVEKNVTTAIKDFGLTYPIVQDNNFDTWRAYSNQYWPAKYIIDKDGNVRYTHFGEGSYNETEKVIQELLKEAGTAIDMNVNNPRYEIMARTPETYLGNKRRDPFNRIIKFGGDWNFTEEYAVPRQGASLTLDFEAKDVFLVMSHADGESPVKVFLDGEPSYPLLVKEEKLYHVIKLKNPGKHQLILRFGDGGFKLYAFTFG